MKKNLTKKLLTLLAALVLVVNAAYVAPPPSVPGPTPPPISARDILPNHENG